jgi:hypothetical protein
VRAGTGITPHAPRLASHEAGYHESLEAPLFPATKSDPELAPSRAGLLFGFFNALTWQIGMGTPRVLFAERLGANRFKGNNWK